MENQEIYENENYITLRSANGEELNFIDIAGIALSHGFYAIMQPVELLEGMEEDEAFVFKVEKIGDDDNSYTLVDDDTVIDEVFAEYGRLLDEAEEQL